MLETYIQQEMVVANSEQVNPIVLIPSARETLKKYGKLFFVGALLTFCCLGNIIVAQVGASSTANTIALITLAERQQLLTQRISKSLLALRDDMAQQLPMEVDQNELNLGVTLFEETLNAFAAGGSVTVPGNQMLAVSALASDKGREIIGQTQKQWTSLMEKIKPVLIGPQVGRPATSEQIERAANAARLANLRLQSLAVELTDELKILQKDKARYQLQAHLLLGLLAILSAWFLIFQAIEQRSALRGGRRDPVTRVVPPQQRPAAEAKKAADPVAATK